jgi:hypothetical protein
VRTDTYKEFVNFKIRKLVGEGIEMNVCRIPTVNCAIVERFNKMLKSKLYKWITRNNRYVDVRYNNAVH